MAGRWLIALALAALLNSQALAARASDAASDIVIEQSVFGPAAGSPLKFTPRGVDWWNRRIRQGIADSYRKHRGHVDTAKIRVSTQIVTLGRHKVFRTRGEVPGRLFFHQYAGAVRTKVLILLCESRTGRPFNVRGSQCERQAARVFGG